MKKIEFVTIKCPKCGHTWQHNNTANPLGDIHLLICPKCGFNLSG